MSFAQAYLEKVSLDPRIDAQHPSQNLSMVVTIPACNEPNILESLQCLARCQSPKGDIEIIIVLNSSETASNEVVLQNKTSENEIINFINDHHTKNFRILFTNISGIKHRDAGAGYARKIAMDHAVSRFQQLQSPEGIIVSFDADTLCDESYLTSIEEHFDSNPEYRACSVYFEHPLEGSDFPTSVYHGITEYELHLRYYIEGLRFSGHPHAYFTLGSAFCIRAGTYISQGGMNKRSAGEDFYFLQKIIPLGNYNELNSTRVIPSPDPVCG